MEPDEPTSTLLIFREAVGGAAEPGETDEERMIQLSGINLTDLFHPCIYAYFSKAQRYLIEMDTLRGQSSGTLLVKMWFAVAKCVPVYMRFLSRVQLRGKHVVITGPYSAKTESMMNDNIGVKSENQYYESPQNKDIRSCILLKNLPPPEEVRGVDIPGLIQSLFVSCPVSPIHVSFRIDLAGSYCATVRFIDSRHASLAHSFLSNRSTPLRLPNIANDLAFYLLRDVDKKSLMTDIWMYHSEDVMPALKAVQSNANYGRSEYGIPLKSARAGAEDLLLSSNIGGAKPANGDFDFTDGSEAASYRCDHPAAASLDAGPPARSRGSGLLPPPRPGRTLLPHPALRRPAGYPMPARGAHWPRPGMMPPGAMYGRPLRAHPAMMMMRGRAMLMRGPRPGFPRGHPYFQARAAYIPAAEAGYQAAYYPAAAEEDDGYGAYDPSAAEAEAYEEEVAEEGDVEGEYYAEESEEVGMEEEEAYEEDVPVVQYAQEVKPMSSWDALVAGFKGGLEQKDLLYASGTPAWRGMKRKAPEPLGAVFARQRKAGSAAADDNPNRLPVGQGFGTFSEFAVDPYTMSKAKTSNYMDFSADTF